MKLFEFMMIPKVKELFYVYMFCRNKDGYDLGEIDPSLFLYLDGQGHHDPPTTTPSPLPHHHTTRMLSLSLSPFFFGNWGLVSVLADKEDSLDERERERERAQQKHAKQISIFLLPSVLYFQL